MLGTVERAQVGELLRALADGDGGKLMAEVAEMAQYSPDFGGVLEDLASELHRIQLHQLVPGFESEESRIDAAAALSCRPNRRSVSDGSTTPHWAAPSPRAASRGVARAGVSPGGDAMLPPAGVTHKRPGLASAAKRLRQSRTRFRPSRRGFRTHPVAATRPVRPSPMRAASSCRWSKRKTGLRWWLRGKAPCNSVAGLLRLPGRCAQAALARCRRPPA
jgi:DNA polymerase-3 subunit gamma/tau